MNKNPHGLRVAARPAALALAAALALGTAAAHATPFPTRDTPAARELGAAATRSITVSVLLKNRNDADLKRLVDELHTPGSAQFRKFLTPAQFHARFDPSAQTVEAASAYFRAAGLAVARDGYVLEVSGPTHAIEAAFGVELREYEIAAHGHAPAVRFHAPASEAALRSAAVADSVLAIVGLDDSPRFAPNMAHSPLAAQRDAVHAAGVGGHAHEPGYLTVKDVASRYNVAPLYDAGLHGEGRTIGIVTLASFTQSDVYQYWSENGIPVKSDRIRVRDVHGGAGPISDLGGSGETTLDVAQSGGLAPAAKIVVYEAPNDSRAFVGAFHKAVDDNVADSISVSWGTFESAYAGEHMHAKSTNVTVLKAMNQVFMQAAAQGQTLIAAQGDAGAYEVNRSAPLPYFTPTLSVGAPAASPYITSAGATTLPGDQRYVVAGKPWIITIPTEQAWTTTYLIDLTVALGSDPVSFGIWGAGTGGGVSSYFPIPSYQQATPGMAVTEAGQTLVEHDVDPPVVLGTLPAGFAGRNVPDIALNGDPNTGFLLDYTNQNGSYGVETFGGGTSFVAPQLNGIAALLAQRVGGRIGLLNYALYDLASQATAYGQPSSPFNDIVAGDNWFYQGAPGYDQASGLGTLNVANLADALVARNASK